MDWSSLHMMYAVNYKNLHTCTKWGFAFMDAPAEGTSSATSERNRIILRKTEKIQDKCGRSARCLSDVLIETVTQGWMYAHGSF